MSLTWERDTEFFTFQNIKLEIRMQQIHLCSKVNGLLWKGIFPVTLTTQNASRQGGIHPYEHNLSHTHSHTLMVQRQVSVSFAQGAADQTTNLPIAGKKLLLPAFGCCFSQTRLGNGSPSLILRFSLNGIMLSVRDVIETKQLSQESLTHNLFSN